MGKGKVPLNLPFSRLNNPRSLKPSHMTHAPFLNHLYGTLLDLLQYVCPCLSCNKEPIFGHRSQTQMVTSATRAIDGLWSSWSPSGPQGPFWGHACSSVWGYSCPAPALIISLGWTSWGSCHISPACSGPPGWQHNSGAPATPPSFISSANVLTQQHNQPGSLTMRLNSCGPSINPWATSSDCPLAGHGSVPRHSEFSLHFTVHLLKAG